MTSTDLRPARPFGAVGTAVVTPLTEDGHGVDLDAAQQLAVHVSEHGNDLIVVSGTTGEAPTLTDVEKIELSRAVRDAVGPEVRVVAGVGTYDTAHSIDLARAHADLGLDGLLVVTPYYSKPSQAGVIAHTTAIADSTDLPVMLYDIPSRTGTALSYETLLRLGEHDRILAVKDAKGDLQQASRIMAETGLAYYSGEDALNLPWLTIGAAGLVSVVGQVAGELERLMLDAVDRSDLAGALDAHRRLVPLVDAIMAKMPGAVAAKAALALQGVLPHAAMRGPHVPADTDQLRALADAIDAADGIPSCDPTRASV
ncbi:MULTISPECIES: 4-hydroxy-tetrahydrodipicolinate synthase [Brachybacterium]|uniref:4-hydroxy-tetrahydrodipicolinate synthase n=1 Tax=Brachybacterium TaxID=43668 RepID=UPI000DF23F17|nr:MULTISPECIES: 4-hydroxy-tetrahydrodipicolinate synthase [Brachybacterium]RCS61592.1 4-hydroxy-tetrahydrodipicolinate synthase [Brachybacterium sp. JB7]RCS80448.1 4-hydroxy-tetrahydrodipicolinate synthase [Brachybacterium alimentarium]RCS82950.1 4-hydroxy-tetrahydrodipicolinate synthase [Brachybacterium alimentarium]RCS90172.1 4-hydroxy-tetrahydrodipicolinate synthase [Brachybacterium alimentarium]